MINKNNSICHYCCSLSTNQCYYCYLQDISSLSRYCNYSYSITIEEIFIWIIICLLIFLLYNTIKLCIIIFLILSIIYWIYKQRKIFPMLKEFYQKQFNSKSTINEQKSNDNSIQNNNIIHHDDNQELNTIDNRNVNDQYSFSSKTLSNSNFDISIISNNDFSKANNYDDVTIKTNEESDKNLNEKKNSNQSTTKKLFSTIFCSCIPSRQR